MKVQELFENDSVKRAHIFIDKSSFDRSAMTEYAKEIGVKFTARGTNDKDLPGYDVYASGPIDKIADFFLRYGLTAKTSKKKALEFIKNQF